MFGHIVVLIIGGMILETMFKSIGPIFDWRPRRKRRHW